MADNEQKFEESKEPELKKQKLEKGIADGCVADDHSSCAIMDCDEDDINIQNLGSTFPGSELKPVEGRTSEIESVDSASTEDKSEETSWDLMDPTGEQEEEDESSSKVGVGCIDSDDSDMDDPLYKDLNLHVVSRYNSVKEMSDFAITIYNGENGTKYKVGKITWGRVYFCAGFGYDFTFEADDGNAGNGVAVFRASVYKDIHGQLEFNSCQLQSTVDLYNSSSH